MTFSEMITQITQFGGGIIGQLISFVIFILFISFYSRIMVQQIMFKLEKSANMLEMMSNKAEKIVLRKIKKRPDKNLKKSVKQFLEFFAISPVSTDPYGIMKKLEHVIDLEKERFNYFVGQVASHLNSENRANVVMGLSGAMSLYQVTKIMRHFVELIKKTKSVNLALILQMQIPLIERMAKALLRGTEALSNGWPIGDGIGAYTAASIIGDSKIDEVDNETIVCRKKIKNRDVIIIKAKGPGGRTGNPGRILNKLSKKYRPAKIISIDAAGKLEGEKTGTIAEGIGVAMGGIGVERSYIENVAVEKKIPLDSIIVKMSPEEAIMPMKKPVIDTVPKVIDLMEKSIERTNGKGKIIIVGVGNTSGIGNKKEDLKEADKMIKKNIAKMKKLEKKKKKRFRIKLPFGF